MVSVVFPLVPYALFAVFDVGRASVGSVFGGGFLVLRRLVLRFVLYVFAVFSAFGSSCFFVFHNFSVPPWYF